MNIRLAKAISTYYKLEHSITSMDCVKIMEEIETLTHFLEMGEMALEEEREYQKKLEAQDKENSKGLRLIKPKDKNTNLEDYEF